MHRYLNRSRREPLIKSPLGQVIAVIALIAGGLWYWEAIGQHRPPRRRLGEVVAVVPALLTLLIASIPIFSRPARWSVVAICVPLAALLAWATVASYRTDDQSIRATIIIGAAIAFGVGGIALFKLGMKRR